ncbi:sce7725 family protein [Algoriphagus sp. Y33]|uniref:sce7725 family protein n=1 Tax=Algoriphagus sp. Y33 TaxID=2772483 RepID=UPI001780C7A3|nr:sce7725 family protein [Algoriphagus sp. Y33]
MYFPFLRGKQFELIALRELVSLPLDANKVSPIVEPLKKNLNSVATAAKALKIIGVKVQLIVNPQHGDLKDNTDEVLKFISIQELSYGTDNLIPTFLIQNTSDFQALHSFRTNRTWSGNPFSLIHLKQIPEVDQIVHYTEGSQLFANIIHVNQVLALRRKFRKIPSSLLADPFNRQLRNKDYLDLEDEFFSNDYLYFLDEGYAGYGDYLTIGSDFIEGGRLPYAVVIHLTYLDSVSGDIRIRHFLSDSNQDDSDTAGKFYEALTKLVRFVETHRIAETMATSKFKEYYRTQAYPGLGVIKKLSMMHHIELMQSVMK